MKYGEFIIDSNKVEFFNSVFGIESVLLNGKRISRKFSIFGTKHYFVLASKNFSLESQYKPSTSKEIRLDLKENGKTIKSRSVKVDKKHRIFWIALGTALGIYILTS